MTGLSSFASILSQPLSGRTAIVTGASSGIGAATAARLAAQGAAVICAARRLERLEALVASIHEGGGRAFAVPCDVTNAGDRSALVEAALRQTGSIDVLVNNAGWGQRGAVEAVPIERFRENFEANVFGPIALTQLVAPVMRRQRSGRIVMLSSMAGHIARPYSSVYDATKHAIEALSDGMRHELAPFGVRVIVIEPGFIATEFGDVAARTDVEHEAYADHRRHFIEREWKRRRFAGAPDEVARLIVTACTAKAPRARYAAPGHARVALLLKRLLPASIFERIAGLR